MPNIYSSVWIPVDLNNVIQKTDTVYLFALYNQGSVDWTDVDINTAGSSLVPVEANAVIIQPMFGDSGFPATDARCRFRKKGETEDSQRFELRPAGGGQPQYNAMTIGLDSNGYLQFEIVASGVDTADLTVRLMGWIEPAEG